jgi:hypothetical protein
MKIFRHVFFPLLLAITLLAPIFSCKKKNQDALPVIAILAPTENTQFSWTDTIPLQLDIKSTIPLQKVEVKLLDQNQISLITPQVVNLSGNSWQGKISLAINRKIKQSGIHSIQVACTDQDNNRITAFRDINIAIAAAQTTGAIFLSTFPSNNYQAKKIHFNDNQTASYDLRVGNPQGLVYQDKLRKAYYLGNGNSNIFEVDVMENTEKTFATSIAALPFTYHSMVANENFIYASTYQGKIHCYNSDGSILRNYEYQPNVYFPSVFAMSNNHLVAVEMPISGSVYKLVTFDKLTGIGFQEIQIPNPIYKLIYDGQHYYGYAPGPGGHKIYRYNVNNNVLETVFTGTLPIIDFNFIEPNRIIFSNQLGINIYDTELLLNTTLINKAELSQIEIDRDTKTLYVLNENANRLEVFNLTNGTLLNTFAMASPRYFALVKL